MPPESALAERVVRRDARAIARAITVVEQGGAPAADLVGLLHPYTGRARLVGVTGPPGAGKSTLVDRLVTHVRTGGLQVGVLAIDPSSPFTGGAVLGDRVRMGGHASDSGVFIRSMATRGQLGGLSAATSDAALVLDAAGSDVIFIETVGVGQGEVEIARTADVCLVILVPGMGDDVQAMKSGLMEIADIFVVNKADRDGADRLVDAIAGSLALRRAAEQRSVPIVRTRAIDGTGVADVWSAIAAAADVPVDARNSRRRTRDRAHVLGIVRRELMARIGATVPTDLMERVLADVAARRTSPHSVARMIIAIMLGSGSQAGQPASGNAGEDHA